MANDLVWDRRMIDLFTKTAILSDEELAVLEDWAKHKSIVSTAIRCGMSERTVNSVRKNIRMKYDRVQVYTPELPKRNTRP